MTESDREYIRQTYDSGPEYECLIALQKAEKMLAETRDRLRSMTKIRNEDVHHTALQRDRFKQRLAQVEEVLKHSRWCQED